MGSFTNTFGGSAVNPADVAFASYSFSVNPFTLYWPQFSAGQTNVAARFMNLNATTTNLNVYMPDATLASVGYDSIIFNSGSNSFNVVNYGGGAICTIAPGQTYYVLLNNNGSQNGTWQVVQFGVGTGSAVASALAGPGLLAAAGLLQVNLNGNNVSSNFTLTTAGLAQLYVWTGGVGTITIPAASAVGNGFFFMIANNGSGSLSITPSSTTIDGGSSSVFSQTQSGFIVSNGANWYTVGKGIQNTFSVTLLNLNVAGSSNVTETSAQAQNIIQQFTGALTGNIAVIVPATVQLYEVNNLTTGAYTLTVRTAAGTGIVVPQGQTSILYCDGTNVVNGFTASVTSTISLLNGSASGPAISFAASPTTGLFSPGTGMVSLAAAADEVMRFSSQASSVNYFGAVASASTAALAFGAVGTDTNISINIVPKGSGTVTCGLLDGTNIGTNTPGSGAFTTLSASGNVSVNTNKFNVTAASGNTTIAGTLGVTGATTLAALTATGINSSPIGASTPSTGAFTTLSASSTSSFTGAVTLSSTINKLTLTAPATGSTLTIVDGKTLKVDNTLEFAGTDSTVMTFPSTSGTVVTLAATQTLTNKTLTSPTANQLTFSSTSGIIGSTTNDSAAAGSVGEFISSTIASGSAVSLTTATPANITSISITAGDWDVWGVVIFSGVANSTIVQGFSGNVSTSSAVNDTTVGQFSNGYGPAASPFNQISMTAQPGPVRISLSGTTTYYLNCYAYFGTNTLSAYGAIYARRRR